MKKLLVQYNVKLLFILLLALLMHSCGPTLRNAVYKGDVNLVKQALAEGVDVNEKYSGQWTPLLVVVYYGHFEIVKLLLDNDANIEARTEEGRTPLIVAAHEGHTKILDYLIDHGADINARNNDGWSALSYASRYGYPEVVEHLINQGVYIYTKTNADWTPLILAAYSGHFEIVKLLTNTGIKLDAKNGSKKNAIYYAALYKEEDMVEFLIQKGAEIEIFEEKGDGLFATAVMHKVLAEINENEGKISNAEENYCIAADYFEKAVPKLSEMAEYYKRARTARQIVSIVSSSLSIVAGSIDLANIKQGKFTYYSSLVPEVETENMDDYEIMIKIYKEKAKDSSKESEKCREKAEELQNKLN